MSRLSLGSFGALIGIACLALSFAITTDPAGATPSQSVRGLVQDERGHDYDRGVLLVERARMLTSVSIRGHGDGFKAAQNRSASGASTVAAKGDVGLASRGLRPAAGTRVRPKGVPEGWRIRGTDTAGGTRYFDPSNPGNSVRVMQGSPKSPYPNSQGPIERVRLHADLTILAKLACALTRASVSPLVA